MMIEVRYFSWVREKLQKDKETVEWPTKAEVALEEVVTMLMARGGDYAILQSNQALLRYALNYRLAKPTDKIKHGDELAIFPPVTGG